MKIQLITFLLVLVASTSTQGRRPVAVKFVEKILGDSVPLALCKDHPAFGEEPEMFAECSRGQQCFYVAADTSLTTFGTWCDFDWNGSEGSGSEWSGSEGSGSEGSGSEGSGSGASNQKENGFDKLQKLFGGDD